MAKNPAAPIDPDQGAKSIGEAILLFNQGVYDAQEMTDRIFEIIYGVYNAGIYAGALAAVKR